MFWGGPTTCPAELAERRDSIPAAVVPVGTFYYDSYIAALDPRQYGSIGEWQPPPAPQPDHLDHDAIDDGSEKSSVRWYCQDGIWWKLPGGD
jgi:hypothetical protein